ncbi:MAG: hypothetical protein JKY96_04790 [Phycisphaerales bacterium]|nr:hypothetical protein [Phycisphaerales bacterium]
MNRHTIKPLIKTCFKPGIAETEVLLGIKSEKPNLISLRLSNAGLTTVTVSVTLEVENVGYSLAIEEAVDSKKSIVIDLSETPVGESDRLLVNANADNTIEAILICAVSGQ